MICMMSKKKKKNMASIIFLPQMNVLKLNVFLSLLKNKFSTSEGFSHKKEKKN